MKVLFLFFLPRKKNEKKKNQTFRRKTTKGYFSRLTEKKNIKIKRKQLAATYGRRAAHAFLCKHE
jgi:hypothetical protein